MNYLENQEIYENLVMEKIKRAGIENLLSWLKSPDSDFFTAPASTVYHLSEKGGLCKHSLNVFQRLIRLCKMEYGSEYLRMKEETLAVISLFHDLCKIDCYDIDYKNVKVTKAEINSVGDSTGFREVWEKVPFYVFKEREPYGHHGSKSVHILQKYIKLTDEESVCITNHMGAFPLPANDWTVSKVFEFYPLAFLLHTADSLASFIDEKVK